MAKYLVLAAKYWVGEPLNRIVYEGDVVDLPPGLKGQSLQELTAEEVAKFPNAKVGGTEELPEGQFTLHQQQRRGNTKTWQQIVDEQAGR